MGNARLLAVLAVGACIGCITESSTQTASTQGEVTPVGDVALPVQSQEAETVKAQVGVGKKGRSLDNETGVLVEPAKSLFAFQERAVFNIQIPQALQLFKGSEGRGPNSHEEFMSRIIQANNIQLPQLPQGQRYFYDPQRGELMVIRPKK